MAGTYSRYVFAVLAQRGEEVLLLRTTVGLIPSRLRPA